MGRKPDSETAVDEEAAEVEDTPVIKALKENDDKYLAVEEELDAEIAKLTRQYKAKLDPLLEERRKVLEKPAADATHADASKATPGCSGFWFTALTRLPSTADEIEPHDEEVLEYLADVRAEDLDPEDETKGFKVDFEFVSNPFFTNDVLSVEFHTKRGNPYNRDEWTCTEIKATEIDWMPGKDVTVEKVGKKVKGGGAKKKKQKDKETVEPRASFFRNTFRNMKLGDPLPDDLDVAEIMDQNEMDDEDEFLEKFLENQMEIFYMVYESLIPHAVRVYTGEAFPELGDDDEESEEEDNDGDSEEESPDSPAAKKNSSAKKKAAPKENMTNKEKEECKQQ